MGQKISVPERIHRAAKLNDIAELQALCADMRLNTALDTATKQSFLNHCDEEGRTALMWAAGKNHLHVAQLLLDEGADIHAIAPKRQQGGSALAEAIAGRHEAVVELLLRYGADPFTENPGGKTPMDLALESRAVNILRACERQALFCGYVSTRVGQLKGFSYTSKDRWVVIAPRFTPPPPGGSVGEVRVTMMLFRNAAEADPRTRMWLDGAAVSMAGGEALLRLHPNHVQPRNIHSQYNSGWTMFFAPARAQGLVPSGALPPQQPDAAFAAFLATASRPLEQLQQQQQVRLAAATANPWQSHGAPAASIPQPGYGAAYAQQQQQQQQQYAQQQQQPYMHAGLQMRPQAAPPSVSYHQQQQQAGNEFGVVAQPGESDEAFALRLAAMYGGNAGAAGGSGAASPTSTAALSAAGSNAPSRLGSTTTQARPQQQQQQQQQQDSSNPFVQGAGLPHASDNPFMAHGASSAAGQQPQQPQQQAAAQPPTRLSDGGVPSAPSQAAATAAPAASSAGGMDSFVGGGDSDADQCVICLSAPREVGLLHGATVHKCLCKECAPMVREGAPCPLCRQRVERVLGVY